MVVNFYFFSCHLQIAETILISGYLECILQARLRITEKFLKKRQVIFSDDVLADVDVVFAELPVILAGTASQPTVNNGAHHLWELV